MLSINKCRLTVWACTMALSGALGAYAEDIDGLSYALDAESRSAAVTGFANDIAMRQLIIPDQVTYDGVTYDVTSIADNAFYYHYSEINSIEIGNNVTVIGRNAFSNCTATSVKFGSKVTSIGTHAFGEGKFTELVFPESLQTIGNQAFSGCENLSEVAFQGDNLTEIQASAFYRCYRLKSIDIPQSVTTLGNGVFEESGLTTVSLSDGLKAIPDRAFTRCDIESVEIPSSVTSVGDYAFAWCKLKVIDVPGSVRNVGDWAFATNPCESLTLGDGIETIGEFAFVSLSDVTFVSIPPSVTSMGFSVFSGTKLEDMVLSPNLKEIPDFAFSECNLGEVNVPEGVETIGASAFAKNPALKSVYIPGTVKTIKQHAFNDCPINNLTISEGVEDIELMAFDGGFCAETIVLPSSVKSIGRFAVFSIEMQKLVVNNPVPCKIDTESFANYTTATLIVPPGSADDYRTAYGWKQFNHIEEAAAGAVTAVDEDLDEPVATQFYTLEGVRISRPVDNVPYLRLDITTSGQQRVTKILDN